MHYLLDANACIDVMRGHPSVLARFDAVSPADCAISTITSFELLTGVQKCLRPTRETAKVQRLLGQVAVLAFDPAAAAESAEVRAQLEMEGCVIGPYDTLIAGHARATGLILVSNNVREFSRVARLPLENWRL
ncbi:MAG TPA: type II toxin-antitoxin system VapC family toxin [Chthoniobacteraceae bacterium]|nr:type II toxin-antitoxin system VapC family toxin [Chthoniobacteraceae bacterium]